LAAKSKIRKSARGEDCQVRIPEVCNGNPETTVFAHLGGGGMGAKMPDLFGAYCCSDCHDLVDGRSQCSDISDASIKADFYDGIFRTQLILIEKGLIIIK